MLTLIFVRHGEVENPDHIYYGRIPGFSLSAVGRAQARAAGEALKAYPVSAIYSSPQQRALETAHLITDALECPAQIKPVQHEALNEVFTPFDGSSQAEMRARAWDLYSGTQPSYEQPADVVARARSFATELYARHPGETVVAVTHGDVIAFMILWARGLALLPGERAQLLQQGVVDGYPAPASLSVFGYAQADAMPDFTYLRPY